MALMKKAEPTEARQVFADAIASFNWAPENADRRDAWICHILRREAEQVVAKISTDQRVLVEIIEGASADQLQGIANLMKKKGFAGIAVLFGKGAEQIHLLVTVDSALTKSVQAGKIVQELTALLGGKGGGRPDMARGVGKDLSQLDFAKQRALELTAGF